MAAELESEDYSRAATAISNASFLLVMAGAGMSAESGLKTYEEINDTISSKNLEYADYCDPDLLRDDPVEFWKFWGASSADYEEARPHRGYEILQKWRNKKSASESKVQNEFFKELLQDYKHFPSSFFVYTSNVDGLFRKAGIPDEEILEIHGNSNTLQCADGIRCSSRTWPIDLPVNTSSVESLPVCPVCHKICRPSVLMFNDEEWLGLEDEGTSDFNLYDTWEEGMESFMRENESASLVILEIGCGDRVPVVKMESEVVLGDVTNVLTENGSHNIDSVTDRVMLIRINVKKSLYLDYHEEWSKGNSFINPRSIICLEGSCKEVLEKLDALVLPVY